MDARSLEDLLHLSGLTAPVPVLLARALELRAGFLGQIAPTWNGWRLVPRTGELVSPDGEVWTAEQLRGLHWHHERLAAERSALRAQIRVLEDENARLRSAEPVPPSYPPNVVPLRPRNTA